ncbi:hypothetical protein [Lysinibacillus cavernae]|uniref:hypothetical protein n=1 Tax=Lysinibacillus cavernae TaxID=2666135 RepID=UPI0018C1DD00|nr:hypothetical protein [Lysinibacillus cavernae]
MYNNEKNRVNERVEVGVGKYEKLKVFQLHYPLAKVKIIRNGLTHTDEVKECLQNYSMQ